MTEGWLIPDAVFDGEILRSGAAIHIADGVVTDIASASGLNGQRIAGTICPGFVDLQVNGGGGVLFNSQPSVQGLRSIAAAHRNTGTNTILPTIITDTAEVMSKACEAVLSSDVLGVHFEGPHISPGRRGTHAPEHIRRMEQITFDLVQRLRDADKVVVVTLAPELVSPRDISSLVEIGATVSLGHTDATLEQMNTGFEAGATMVTHLFNAMSPLKHRAPGAVGAALQSNAFVGLIADGHHVDDAALDIAIRASNGSPYLVSDAMPSVGGPAHFDLYGQTVSLNGGRLENEDGNLAGAHCTMADGVARLISHVGVEPEPALQMATAVPAAAIGRPELGRLLGRKSRDVLLLDQSWGFAGWLG